MVLTHLQHLQKSWINAGMFAPKSSELFPKVQTPGVHCSCEICSLEYGAAVWDPYLKQDIEKLERIQRQAARFITKDKSRNAGCIGQMLQDLELPLLEDRRRHPCVSANST